MRKRFNRFLYKKWPWAYAKVRAARIWFYKFQEDYNRANDVISEPIVFGQVWPKTREWFGYDDDGTFNHDLHEFFEADKVFPRN